MNNQMVGSMTFHTKRWLDNNYSFNSIKIESAKDIKKFIWNKYKDSFKNEKDKNDFIKGIALCNFDALYEWKELNTTCI